MKTPCIVTDNNKVDQYKIELEKNGLNDYVVEAGDSADRSKIKITCEDHQVVFVRATVEVVENFFKNK